MSSRVAVLGGMFDPVHNGHVKAAQFALRKLFVDCLKMIPCHRPNHKQAASAEAQHRLAMLEIVTSDLAQIEVDPIELNRNRPSYTVDTLAELKKHFDSLVFVLGVDSFNTLREWHCWEMILELSHLLVLARPGSTLSEEVMSAVNFEQRKVDSGEQLFAEDEGRIMYCDDFNFDVASSIVREKIIKNLDLSGELDQRVIQYIMENHLYRESKT